MSDIVKKMLASPNFCAASGVSNGQIKQAELALDLKFSNEYRTYLAAFGVASFGGHEMTGICSSMRLNVVHVTDEERFRNQSIPPDWYVIEQANIDGIVIWQSGTGDVYQTVPGEQHAMIFRSLREYLDI